MSANKGKPSIKGQQTLARWFAKPSPSSKPLDENMSPPTANTPVAPASKQPVTKVTPNGTSQAGPEVVGRALSLYWTADDAWYTGTVIAYNPDNGQHHIRYNDGELEWVLLGREQVRWGDAANGTAAATNNTPKAAAKTAKTNKKTTNGVAVKNKGSNTATKGSNNTAVPSRKRLRKAVSDAQQGDDVPVDVMDVDDVFSEEDEEEEVEGSSGDEGSDWEADAKNMVVEEEDDDDDEDLVSEHEEEDAEEGSMSDEEEEEEEDDTYSKSRGKSKKGPQASKGGKKRGAPVQTPAPVKKIKVGASTSGRPPLPSTTSKARSAARNPLTPTPWPLKTPTQGPGSTPSGPATPGTAATPSSASRAALLAAGDEERWQDRVASKLTFLLPENTRDANGRKPHDADYDPRTLHIPGTWFKQHKISDGQRQWWECKAANYDSLILFKVGKFYEIFEMDAYVGAEILGLQWMRDERPHCGFPEINYSQHGETLARSGLRVVVVEQTETPEQLEQRNQKRKAQGLPKCNVVRREAVAVLTVGTLTDPEMLVKQPNASYFACIVELPLPEGPVYLATAVGANKSNNNNNNKYNDNNNNNNNDDDGTDDGAVTTTTMTSAPQKGGVRYTTWMGLVAVDCASGKMMVGQWYDDELRSRLRAQLAALQPVELVLPKNGLAAETNAVLKACLRQPRINHIPPGDRFWTAHTLTHQLSSSGYFDKQPTWPHNYQVLCEDIDGNGAALYALGGAVAYLRDCLLDERIVPLGFLEALPGCEGVDGGLVGGERMQAVQQLAQHVTLDGAALENLEVLENSTGGTKGTLLAAVDSCVTASGRRLLRDWLTRPLTAVNDIKMRQQAVNALMGPAYDALCDARSVLSGMPDIERVLARLTAAANEMGLGRYAPHVVLYEDVSRRKVQQLVSAVKGLEALQRAVDCFAGIVNDPTASPPLLASLITPGSIFPDIRTPLSSLLTAVDWEEVSSTLTIDPKEGMDQEYDAAVAAYREVQEKLQGCLREFAGMVGARGAKFVTLHKDPCVIEIPEACASKVPSDYELVGGRNGFKRYSHEQLRAFRAQRDAAESAREDAAAGIIQRLVQRVVQHGELYRRAVAAVAQVDVLGSLAMAGRQADGVMCVPTFVEGPTQVFSARALRHPAGLAIHGGSFVPNDITLGGQGTPNFILLTGPNMGGKSTLLRQVCQATLLAQVGALVPAEELTLSAVDAMFVRMGARDNIMAGQSTFFVELNETSMMLNRATPRSLVALDELGRGTATVDGAAIAAAVLQHLSQHIGCRGLFATHYHKLADAHAHDATVAVKHMGCAVDQGENGVPEVTFLYTLMDGACPKSYGTNVARLAGLPSALVQRAAAFSHQLEAGDDEGGCEKGPVGDGGEAGLLGRVRAIVEGSGSEEDKVRQLLSLQQEA